MIELLFFIPVILFVVFVGAFTIATILDLIQSRRNKRDLFYQLSRDHNKRRRPAAK